MSNRSILLKEMIHNLELPLLTFPVLATCIVAIGLVFKLPCAAWEWWLAVALTLGLIGWQQKEWRLKVLVSAAFLLTLGLVWLLTHLFITTGNMDSIGYHQPAVRMLAAGWNPVWQNTPEGIFASTGIPADACHIWHVISMPKGVWYFCAAAYQFTNAHFNILFPLALFLSVSLVYSIFDTFGKKGRLVALAACTLAFCFITVTYDTIVDLVVAIAGVGLLTTMAHHLTDGKWNWPRLLIFSFWMMVAKQTALLHCFIFWCVFCTVLLWQKDFGHFSRAIRAGIVLLVMFVIVNASPYLSSAINYGSPFYPRYSRDETKFPTHNFTADFLDRNDDAKAMGHAGAYVNAFISPSLAKVYYVWRTGKKDFTPDVSAWGSCGPKRSKGAPTSFLYRMAFCLSLAFLIAFGRVPGRFCAISIILGTLALPTEMVGYTRYTPWALSGCLLFIPSIFAQLPIHTLRRTILAGVLCMTGGYLFCSLSFFYATKIDLCHAIQISLKNNPPSTTVAMYRERSASFNNQKRGSGNLLLLRKRVPQLAAAKLIIASPEHSVLFDNCQHYFDNNFTVPSDYNIKGLSRFWATISIPDRKKRFLSYPKFIAQTFFITLPKSIWGIIRG